MDTVDRRVKRTQQLLAKALIALTLEKRYEVITIREITERADIGYATFFRHYVDKDALLQDVLNVVLVELMALLSPSAERVPDPGEVGVPLFRFVEEHSNVFRVLLRSQGTTNFRHVIEVATDNVLQQYREREGSVVPGEIAAHHLVASSIALIEWWLEHDMPHPPERMGEIYAKLIILPTIRLAFVPGLE